MKFFQKDPVASLQGTRDTLAREEAAIAALTETRPQRLVETDDPGPVAKIDEQIERHARNAKVLRDKIPQIQAEIRRQAAERQEQERQAAIKAIAAKLWERDAVAAELEAAVKRVAELFATAASDMELQKLWPFPAPYANWAIGGLSMATLFQLFKLTSHNSPTLFPHEFNSLINRAAGSKSITETATGHTERLLAGLAKVDLPEAEVDEDNEPEPEAEEEAA